MKQKSESLGKQVLNAITDALKEPTTPTAAPAKFTPRPDLDGVPYPGKEICIAIAKMSGFEISKAVAAQIAALDSRHDRATAGTAAHTHEAARKDYAAAQAKLVADAANPGVDVAAQEAYTFEDYCEDYKLKMRSYQVARMNICRESLPLVKPLIEDFAAKADALGLKLEAEEIALHRELGGVAYKRSNVVLACYKAADGVRWNLTTLNPDSGAKPSALIETLPLSKIVPQ